METETLEQLDSIKLTKNSLGVGYEIKVYGKENLLEKIKELKNKVEVEFKDELIKTKELKNKEDIEFQNKLRKMKIKDGIEPD